MNADRLECLPAALQEVLRPLLKQVAAVTEQIYVYDERIEQIARNQYPETKLLQQVNGVGTLIALSRAGSVPDGRSHSNSKRVRTVLAQQQPAGCGNAFRGSARFVRISTPPWPEPVRIPGADA